MPLRGYQEMGLVQSLSAFLLYIQIIVGKARQMALDIHELQRKLESTHHEVRALTVALQLASPPPSAEPLLSPQSASTLTPPSIAPGFEVPPPFSDQRLAMANPADALGLLQLQSPVPDTQLQPALIFQELEVTPAYQAMMYV